MKKRIVDEGRRRELQRLDCPNVDRKRRRELRSLSSLQLLALIQFWKEALTLGERRFIHDLAAYRLTKGDPTADEILEAVRPLI